MELAEFKDRYSSVSKASIEFVSGLCANECDRYFETVEHNIFINSMENCKRVAYISTPPRHLFRERTMIKRIAVVNGTKCTISTLNDGEYCTKQNKVYGIFGNRKSFSGHSCLTLHCLSLLGFIKLRPVIGNVVFCWLLSRMIVVSQTLFFHYFHLLVQSTCGRRKCSLALKRNRLLKYSNSNQPIAKHTKQLNNDELCTINEKNRQRHAENNSKKVCSF